MIDDTTQTNICAASDNLMPFPQRLSYLLSNCNTTFKCHAKYLVKAIFVYFLDVATIINSEDNPITSSGQILPLFEFNEHLSVLNRLDKTDYEAKQTKNLFSMNTYNLNTNWLIDISVQRYNI